MKRGYVVLIVIVAVVLVLFFWIKGMYNSMVRMDEGVSSAWAQVENVYQRRADLVPNLVATVKGYAEHESSTLEAVVNARAKATQMTVDPSSLSEAEIAQFTAAHRLPMPSSGRPFSEVAAVTAAVFPAAASPVVSEVGSEVGSEVEVSAAVEPAAPGSVPLSAETSD